MKMHWLAIAVFLIGTPGVAWAIHPAAEKDKPLIQSYINDSKAWQTYINELKDELNGIDVAPSRVTEIRAMIRDLERARDRQRDKAIHLTLRAYGLAQVGAEERLTMPDGVSVIPGFENKRVSWIPVAREDHERPIQTADGEFIKLVLAPEDRDAVAFTSADGVTTLNASAFTTPGLLALTLLHEKTHFEQMITKGIGDKLSRAEVEIRAYSKEARAMDMVGLTPAERDYEKNFVDGQLEHWRELKAKSGKGLKSLFGGAKAAPAPKLDDPGNLSAVQRGFDDLEARVSEEIQNARQEANKQRFIAPPPTPAAPPEEFPAAKLARIAQMACESPPSLTQEEIDQRFPTGRVFSGEFRDCAKKKKLLSLFGCAAAIFDDFCSDADTGWMLYVDLRGILGGASNYHLQGTTTYHPPPPPATPPEPASPPPDIPDDPEPRHPNKPDPRCGRGENGSPPWCAP